MASSPVWMRCSGAWPAAQAPVGCPWRLASPRTIPTNQVREVLDKLCQANETKLDSLAADQRLNKGVLYHTMSDKYNAKLEIIIQSEVGPHGRERMVNIKRESHGQQQKVKVPWIQLPRFIVHSIRTMQRHLRLQKSLSWNKDMSPEYQLSPFQRSSRKKSYHLSWRNKRSEGWYLYQAKRRIVQWVQKSGWWDGSST